MVAHELMTVAGHPEERDRSAECSCGWRSACSWSATDALSRWRFHVVQCDAAIRFDDAVTVRRLVAARRIELIAARAEANDVRRRITMQHRHLQVQPLPTRWAALAGAARAAQLEHARAFLELPVADLWLGYVAVGGNAGADRLTRMLAGAPAMSRIDHDRVALVLNERFAATGFGRPVCYWDDVR